MNRTHPIAILLVLIALPARAQLPAAPAEWSDFPVSFDESAPGPFAADVLLDKPAGRLGPVVVKGSHFFTGDRRIRFWGVNVCFSACFPTHAQADRTAARLARFGVNAVRFHHMDNQKFPGGIFADDKREVLSPEALDRLDYFVAALKKQGIYTNLNLHVSRHWSKAHQWENADKLPESYDKIVDLFHPELIEANKRYARDLLSHVNKYTGLSYAADPAVCMVEINNEDTLFLWGGYNAIARLPEPYAGMLRKRWNEWLVKKYDTREKLAAAWSKGEDPLGPDLLQDPTFATLGRRGSKWVIEQHSGAKMSAGRPLADGLLPISIESVTDTAWHLQLNQPGLKISKGRFYTVVVEAKSTEARTITVSVAQAHAPYMNLGLSVPMTFKPGKHRTARFGFVATDDDDNARVSVAMGTKTGTLRVGIAMKQGGREGLRDDEDPGAGTVASFAPTIPSTQARTVDWFDFLQQTDEAYWVSMREFLRNDLKVQAPITGTIGLGPLGTLSQSKMDFVDAHAYWDHPQFPGQSWSASNWTIKNTPMVDDPAGATLWPLAATRVAGKPSTVTEYNHSAPNDWQAEAIPMIAAHAALQDWDGVFLFSYSHSDRMEKGRSTSFFDIEGNPAKMFAMPLAARLFLGQGVEPFDSAVTLPARRADLLSHGVEDYYQIDRTWKRALPEFWKDGLAMRLQIAFDGAPRAMERARSTDRLTWTTKGTATGAFTLTDTRALVHVGFTGAGPVRLQSPFAAITLIPADPAKTLNDADRLLLTATARTQNPGMVWNAKRTSVSTNWGKAPPQIEVVKGSLQLDHDYTVRALDAAGKVIREFATDDKTVRLGGAPTLWYELVRR